MSIDTCFFTLCFVPLDVGAPKFFGFSEFLAGLALMILAWTIADVRYRFRIETAPVPLQKLTFWVVVAVGVLTLLTDLWRVEGWLVPRGNVLTPAIWQAILAGLLFLTFLTWVWFAFIKPSTYGKSNASRFAQTIYSFILKGSPSDLAVVADELSFSAKSLVKYATNLDRFEHNRKNAKNIESRKDIPLVEAYANDILSLIADKRFCRIIIQSSPITAQVIFQEMRDSKKHEIQINTFAKNILNEAIINKDSFIYHEVEGYESGLIGYMKPLSQAMFSNYKMVEAVGTLLEPDIWKKAEWDAGQWRAYCRVVLMTFKDYVASAPYSSSFVLNRAISYIGNAVSDLYKLNDQSSIWDNDSVHRLHVITDFIESSIEILNDISVPQHIQLRIRGNYENQLDSIYDHIAKMIFEVIFHSSAIRSPQWESWVIQHNSLWSTLFSSYKMKNAAGRVVKFKLRRLLYNEIIRMERFPNFKGAKILGFCLNVMGLTYRKGSYESEYLALHKTVLSWTKENYIRLHEYNPRISGHCLVDGFTFESNTKRIVKTYSTTGLRKEPFYEYLYVNPTPPKIDSTDM